MLARALPLKYPDRGGHPVEHPPEVYVDHALPARYVQGIDAAERADARVVDDDLQPAVRFYGDFPD